MNKIVIIKRITDSKAEYFKFGGESRNDVFSPKGIFSKAQKDEEGLAVGLLNGNSSDIVIPKQKEIDINDGDVVVTDGKSKILFEYKNGKLIIEAKEIIYKNCKVKYEGGSIEHDGTKIDKTHKHKYQQQDKASGTGVINTPVILPTKTEVPS